MSEQAIGSIQSESQFLFLFRKLRSNEHGQLLIQMCVSLVGLYISFLISSFLGIHYDKILDAVQRPICIGFSALVHYFFLVYFLISAAQSILLYLRLVKVLGTENVLNNYHLKVALVCWGKRACEHIS